MEETLAVSTQSGAIEPPSADDIIQAHELAVRSASRLIDNGNEFLQKAAECGKLLIAKKAELGHGNFLPWLAENITAFGYDTANDYMKAARYLERAPNLEGATSIRQAVALLEDKPATDPQEREKPPFVVRVVFNTEPAKLDEHQRRDWFEQMRPYCQVAEAFGFIDIKVA